VFEKCRHIHMPDRRLMKNEFFINLLTPARNDEQNNKG